VIDITGGVVSTIGQAGAAIMDPILSLWYALMSALPGIVVAILLLFIGWVVAVLIGRGLRAILEKVGLDRQVQKAKLTKAIGHTKLSMVFGEILKWYVFIVFLQAAIDQLNLGTLTLLLNRLVLWLPNVIVAVVVVLGGLIIAYYVQTKLVEHSKMKGVKFAAGLLKVVILVFAGLIALGQIGVDVTILENTFLLIVGALAVGIALALGIGFGLGFKREAEGLISQIRKNF
tara:strand:+ start:2045 stop:2737 length:693 start_codon:yes stop_codon:yes gene_type:complete